MVLGDWTGQDGVGQEEDGSCTEGRRRKDRGGVNESVM